MRYAMVGLMLAFSALACKGPETMSCSACLTLGPPSPDLSATTSVVPMAGSAPVLEVSASLQNATTTDFFVEQCPLVIRLSPYPPGSYGAGSADECPLGASESKLAPGATLTMTRVLGADTLALFTPGQYQVSVDVTYQEVPAAYPAGWVMGTAAGVVHLPLDTTSH